MPEFQIGDVVQLKSGGPWMVVTRKRDEEAAVYCEWFVAASEVKGHRFPSATLNKATE